MTELVRELPGGPLDVVGDVHGELEVLRELVFRLGYDERGRHPDARRLVFIGDLVDRGPDSPGVVRFVRRMVKEGDALCLLGNHELSLIRGEHKHGNGWFYGEREALGGRHAGFFDSVLLTADEQRAEFREFFCGLPVALERPDLRLVHAAWHFASIDKARSAAPATFFQKATAGALGQDPREARYRAARPRLSDLGLGAPAYDEELAELQLDKQAASPASVLLSGPERKIPSRTPFYAGGEWRFVERDRWWEHYEETPVLVGHYWRTRGEAAAASSERPSVPPAGWWGRGRVYCLDYSIGRRYSERAAGATASFSGHLAAVRWPERTLVFHDGVEIAVEPPSPV